MVEAHLRRSSPGASARARFGAVSFVHRFGAALNRHLHYHCCILDRYHGVLAPNASLRLAAIADGRDANLGGAPPAAKAPATPAAAATKARPSAHCPWALLIARLFLTLPLVCPRCGADRRIVAFITETTPMRRILTHIGEPAEPPRTSPARGPLTWDDPPVDAVPDWEVLAQPLPEYVFDQEVQW